MTHRSPRRVTTALALVLAAAAVLLTGCRGLGGTHDLDYVSGEGNVVQIAPSDRGSAVSVSGTALDGTKVDLASYRGHVVVVNVWASWCGPCGAEAPTLVRAAHALRTTRFVGINVRDTEDNARSFERQFGVPYPSIADEGGETLLQFGKHSPTQAMPSTAVLDTQGRVAALINGEVPSQTTLTDVVEQVARGG